MNRDLPALHRLRIQPLLLVWLLWPSIVSADRGANSAPPPIAVYAAASLSEALQAVAAEYTRATGSRVQCSFAASSVLARQIEQGIEADLFVSADTEWMDYLDRRGLLRTSSRGDLLGNRLALVAPADTPVRLRIEPHFALLAALGGQRLAIADPDMVPAGRYARSALAHLGVWDDVAGHLVRAENVRGALAYVARGEVPLGIVYETDARIEHKVRIVGLFPEDSHPPITYPLALTRDSRPAAEAFAHYLRGPEARTIFERFGFSVLH